MVELEGRPPSHGPPRGSMWGGVIRQGSSVAFVALVGVVLVAVGDLHPESRAIEVMSNHHKTHGYHQAHRIIESDADRMQELTRLVSAADRQAKRASQLRSREATKLQVTPESKVDAETMLAHEAAEKGKELGQELSGIRSELKGMAKTLRKERHEARQEGRLLHKVEGEKRDDMIALHDKEMKVLEARHDVQNAAKAGDVAQLRDAQKRLGDRKDIARGARAEYDQKDKEGDQAQAKARLLEKRARLLDRSMDRKKAKVHNDELKQREKFATSLFLGARANLLRDKVALVAARKKYSSLAELLNDPSTDHQQVEDTLSKIASNIHSWQKLEDADKNEVSAKARLYRKAKEKVAQESISVSNSISVSQSLLQTYASAFTPHEQQLTSLQQQYAYAQPPPQFASAQQQYSPMVRPYAQQLPQYAAASQQHGPPNVQQQAPPQMQQGPPQQRVPGQQASLAAEQAPVSQPSILPGAVGNIPYVYDDKQYLPSAATAKGYPIVWLFADNKTKDKLFFGYQSADGVMHVYNEIKPNGVTRQQAFANEYWTILAADKRTVAVQPFKITQDNQWLSIGNAAQQTLAAK